MVAVTVWIIGWVGYAPPFPRPLGVVITSFFALLALLMVSTIPYPSLKAVRIEGARGYPALVALIVFAVVVLLNHEPMLFGLGLAYVLSGPVVWWLERRKPRDASAALEAGAGTGTGHDA